MTLHLNMTDVSARQPRNALLGRRYTAHTGRGRLAHASQSELLRVMIGRAAILSDTPEKWAETVELLRRHGVDPVGFEDFEEGRPAAIAASGLSPFTNADPEEAGDIL